MKYQTDLLGEKQPALQIEYGHKGWGNTVQGHSREKQETASGELKDNEGGE